VLQALLIFAAAFALYAACAARTVQGGDSGQFTLLGALGGVAHPPGYPLYSALLRAFDALPLGAAHASALTSALLGAAALAALYDATRRLSGAWPAAIAVGTLGLGPVFWRYATVAEVFAGAALTCALILCAAVAIHRGARGPRAQAWLGLAVATGVAHHHSVILLTPLCVWAWIRALPRPLSAEGVARGAAATAAGLAPGFVAYASLMRPGGGWRWGHTETFDGLVHHFLRRDYGTFKLTLHDAGVAWWSHPLIYLEELPRHFFYAGLALAIAGIVFALRPSPRRGLYAAILASWALAGPIFLALFNVPAEGLGRVMAMRFHIPSLVLLAPLIAAGAAHLAGPVASSRRRALLGGLTALVAVQAAVNRRDADHSDWTVLEDYVLNTLSAVEEEALILGNTDSFFFAMLYAQEVLGVRRDVVFIHPLMLSWDWYRALLARQHPDFEPESLAGPRTIPQLVGASWERRPVYVNFAWMARPGMSQRLPPA